MSERIKEKELTFDWKQNEHGIGQNCTYFPLMKMYVFFDTFDVKRTEHSYDPITNTETKQHITEEVMGWKFMAYFCDNSYLCRTIYREVQDAKNEAERYCKCVLEKLLQRLEQEGANEYTPV